MFLVFRLKRRSDRWTLKHVLSVMLNTSQLWSYLISQQFFVSRYWYCPIVQAKILGLGEIKYLAQKLTEPVFWPRSFDSISRAVPQKDSCHTLWGLVFLLVSLLANWVLMYVENVMWGKDGQPICFRLMTFLHKIGFVNEVNFKYSCSGLSAK